MTTFDRFDPFERRIGAAMDDIAGTRPLDYLDDVFRQTARTAQRPRWSFPERWLNLDTTIARPVLFGRRVPYRSIVVLVVLAALLATVAFYVGSQRRVPPPFGPAANGQIAYFAGGDIYVRDALTGAGRLLAGGPGDQFAPTFSPDGTRIAYATGTPDGDVWFFANADGSGAVEFATVPPSGNAQSAWAPDSRRMALVYSVNGIPQLSIADVAGGAPSVVDLNGLLPWDVAWRPPNGQQLLIRAEDSAGRQDLYTVRPDGSELTPFGLSAVSDFGTQYTLSGPTWSPDGSTVAYNSIESGRGPQNELITHFRVRLIAADGSNDRAAAGPEDTYVQEGWPVFSPDGRWILVHRWEFTDQRAGAAGWLALMPADGSAPARDTGPRIPGGEASGLVKLWSPDGTSILMRTGNTEQLFMIDPVTGDSERLDWTSDLPDWQRVALP